MPEEVKVKLHKNAIMVTNCLQRKQLKTPTPELSPKIKKRTQSNNTLSPTTSPLKVSKLLWNSWTPKSSRKAKLKLKETDIPAGLSHQFLEELDINLSNPISSSYDNRRTAADTLSTWIHKNIVLQMSSFRKYWLLSWNI